MSEHYSCFSHRNCEYYPCHETWSETAGRTAEFNCLFCYCPLYLRESCPGDPSYFMDRTGRKVKDCSKCIYPHQPENYAHIMQCLMPQDEIIHVQVAELYRDIVRYLGQNCRFDEMDAEAAKAQRTEAELIYEKLFQHRSIDILLHPFEADCVEQKGFRFGDHMVKCAVLEKISPEWVQGGYIYALHAPELRLRGEVLSVLQQYYVESIQVAVLDAARDWLQAYLSRKHSIRHPHFVTDSFGPGFYGMEISAMPVLCECLELNRIGMKLGDDGNLKPLKSIVGIHLVTVHEVAPVIRDCSSCIGNPGGCRMCRRGGGR